MSYYFLRVGLVKWNIFISGGIKLRKFVTGIITGLALLTLAGCGSTKPSPQSTTMTKSQLKSEYVYISDTMAPVINKLAYNDFSYGSKSTSKIANKALAKLNNHDKDLTKFKNNDNKTEIKSHYNYSEKLLTGIIKKQTGAKVEKQLVNFATQNKKIKKELKVENTVKLATAIKNYQIVAKKNKDSTDKSEFLLGDNGKKNLGDGHVTITDNRTYYFGDSDTSWSPAKIIVNNVEVAKTKQFTVTSGGQSKQYQGIIAINIDTKAVKDVSTYYTQGTVVTSDGQQLDAEPTFSDIKSDVYAGAKTNGNVIFLVPKLRTASSLFNIKYIFSAALSKGSSLEHDFNYQFPLKK